MNFLIGLIEDIYYIIKNFITTIILKSPPEEWLQVDSKYNVLIVPGFGANWEAFYNIAKELHEMEFRIHIVKEVNPYESINVSGDKILNYINNNKLDNLIIISHSKGALISKYILDNSREITNDVLLVITIGAPFQGAKAAKYFVGNPLNLKEISPDSNYVKNLRTDNNENIVNLIPKRNFRTIGRSKLEGAKNIIIDCYGHSNFLHKKEVIEKIKSIINNKILNTLFLNPQS